MTLIIKEDFQCLMKFSNCPRPTDGKVHLYLESTYFCSVSRPQRVGIPPSTCRCTTHHCSHKCVHSRGLLLGRHLSLWRAEQVKCYQHQFSLGFTWEFPSISAPGLQGPLSSVIRGEEGKTEDELQRLQCGLTLPTSSLSPPPSFTSTYVSVS